MKSSKIASLTLKSPAFKNGGNLPERYTCHGKGIHPPLSLALSSLWNVQSLALILEEPNTVSGSDTYWLVWNINPETIEIAENVIPPGAIEGENSFHSVGYTPPCPEFETHRYDFHVFALDTVLALPTGSSRTDLEKAISGHSLAQTCLSVHYAGRPKVNQRKPTSEWSNPYKP